ncbi:peptide/nickel transport system permease protein [Stella humosa]|uniref:Peptide/nickel transport system permease protein n=1 Tax=Stella humosa TaxID=94 RepID=A0A3N1L0S7_9PROT|nr:ABC transporter permease [Stella humosa]ROP83115.1 peptide/nickel transport system permease protein [Stella humosa]BBK30108.1 ABC transporter permease [Stella humosa]
MSSFLLRRLAQSLVLLWIVSMIGFALLHLTPGGPLSQFTNTPGMTDEDLRRLATQMGLDRPLPVQYLEWFGRLLTGDWGRSYRDDNPVLYVIGSRLGATLQLMVTATLIAVLVGGVIGVIGAVKRYSFFDQLVTIGAMIALSIPTFWFGLVVIYVFSVKLGWLPPGNISPVGNESFITFLHHLIGPSMVLGLVTTAIWSRFMRSSMLDVINQDYVRTARAKGLSERIVLVRHVLRNALLPMITIAGLEVPTLLSGALVTETVFTWPGMGRLFLDSIGYRDYPVVMGLLTFTAILVIIGNLLADVLYVVADPRIRLQ